MNSEPDNTGQINPEPLSLDLAFFGKITASVTHELNNVISIVEQLAGLLEDQLCGAESGAPLDTEKVKSVQERIVLQTDRGVDLLRNLNKFAHSVDEERRDTDLNELAGNLYQLSKRFADLKNINLEMEAAGESIIVRTSPFLLQQVLFWVLMAVISSTPSDEVISLAVVPADEKAGVKISCSTPIQWSSEAERFLKRAKVLNSRLEAELIIKESNSSIGVCEIWLPATIIKDVF